MVHSHSSSETMSFTSRRMRVSDNLLETVELPVLQPASEPVPSRGNVVMEVLCELHGRGTYG